MALFRNILELVDMGGPVMIPIGVLSAWMWILIALKADWIRRAGRQSLPLDDAMACLCSETPPPTSGCCPKALALAYFMKQQDGPGRPTDNEPRRIFFEVAVRRQLRDLYRFIPAIMILAAAAPLLGLLGTVSGMVETFRVIGLYGMGNAQAMASGIREALLTTQAGLLVAIPGLIVGQIMRRKVRGLHQDLLVFHRAVCQWLEKEWQPCSD
ncbi:biopolymer transport membrane proton channel, TolQ-related protein [Syntrophotalea carbinolica DSM 2380]|uniref:Biopolymer transport membrane proton channel, TolQ-related protein n=1 Tax=Syntrophotalea carbinolica (strain DSM 2380 / NBRC 103641 / GraBd1) TaxID=338963 RepID=Q3A6A4_SYNC1|nr:MotA/TolQ/ExbB proton channel family protein [Syntrophotalea carbinolica]ABA88103.1 biopolymer transport membrane proton channel, TolQ-related protein [Syntrophotalea carbinolica DSM 2380]